ncbi:MAG: FtsX-like permease family protein [Anaerolineae bacterium]|nr:FtsX-like permease family protein [Anaerolineae bacterium]
MPDWYSQVYVVVQGDPVTQDLANEVAELVEERIEKSGQPVWGYWTPTPGRHPADEVIQPIFMLLGVLGMLVLGLAGFLVLNTISAIMSQHVRHIGIMKAIGGRRSQIVVQYFVMVIAIGVLALFAALPLGALGAKLLIDYIAVLVNVDIESYTAPVGVYVAEAAVAVIVPVVAALIPVTAGTRVTVHRALSTHGLGNTKAGWGLLDRLVLGLHGFSRPILLSLRNTFRRKGRLALTLSTLTLAGAIFVGVVSVHASLMGTLEDAFDYWNHEVGLSFRRPYRMSRIQQAAESHPQVIAAECWGYANAERVLPEGGLSQQFTIIAPPADTRMIKPTIIEGRWLVAEDENAIVVNTYVLKNDPDIQVGDTILLKLAKGSDSIERPRQVVGVVKGLMTGPLAYANYPYFARTMGQVNQAYSVRIQTRNKILGDQEEIARDLEEHFNAQGLRVSSRESLGGIRQRARAQLMIIMNLLLGMSLLFAMVGGLGLMGTMSINVLERTREIGVMRAVGATDRAVEKVVIVEGLVIALVSWCLGGLLAVPLSQGLAQALGMSVLRSPINHVFPLYGVGLWLGMVMLLAALASYLPVRRASSLTVRDVLAYE